MSETRGYLAAMEARDREILRLYRMGFTTYQIGEKVGLSRSRCSQILHERGVPTRPWWGREGRPGKRWATDRRVQHGRSATA